MNKRYALAGLGIAASVSIALCCQKPAMPPEPPYTVFPPEDAAPEAEASAPAAVDDAKLSTPCEAACKNLTKLHCKEAEDAGEDCIDLCEQISDLGVDLNLRCVAKAASKAAVRACGTVRCPD